jgi:hypothetical protein
MAGLSSLELYEDEKKYQKHADHKGAYQEVPYHGEGPSKEISIQQRSGRYALNLLLKQLQAAPQHAYFFPCSAKLCG